MSDTEKQQTETAHKTENISVPATEKRPVRKHRNTIIKHSQERVATEKKINAGPIKTKKEDNIKKPEHTMKIIPLGGLEEIGMNITAFEYHDSIIIVDCGVAFPDGDAPGVDLFIPDVSYLKANIEKVKGFFITHGHEDHIGALPYILKEIDVPVYGTKLTLGVIDSKLEKHDMKHKTKKKEVKFGQKISAGRFNVEFIKTNHSIQDSAALAISSPAGIVIHTGDFKIDHTPVFGDTIDLARFAELGQKKVLAMLCDSTNAEKPGSTMSEKSVGVILDSLFEKYKEKRILVATFASNVDRVQQIINAAYKTGKKVAIDGRSMVNIMNIATSLGYIMLPENTVIDIEALHDYDKKDTVIIMTGSQGEQMAALTRVSNGKHLKIHADMDDVVIFSSHPVPGNEKAVNAVINNFMMNGIEVVLQDVHVSGHACADDIKLLYSLARPEFAIPVHGDFRQRTAQANIVRQLGYGDENIKMLRSGDVLEIGTGYARKIDAVQAGHVMVDGNGVGNIGNIVIRERKQLANDGVVVVSMTFSKKGALIAGPEIICRGFVYIRDSKELLKNMYSIVYSALKPFVNKKEDSYLKYIMYEAVKNDVKDKLSDFLWDEMKAKPIIMAIVMEA